MKKINKASTVQSIEIKPEFMLFGSPAFRRNYRNVFVFKKFSFPGHKTKEALYLLLDKNKGLRSRALTEVIEHYYIVAGTKDKNDALLHYLLDLATEDDVENLNWSFIHADNLKLTDIHPFLYRFVNSRFFRLSNHFLDYLTLQMGCSPLQAVELFDIAVTKKQNDERFAWRIEENSINFIVNALNGLNGKDAESMAAQDRLLNAFDQLMKDQRSRVYSERVLEELL